MVKKPLINEEDKKLFRDTMRGVQKLITKKRVLPQPIVNKTKVMVTKLEEPPLIDVFEDISQPLVGSDELLHFARPGVQHKMLRKLRRGQYNVDAVLDLHGKTIAEARELLGRFLYQAKQQGLRHVLIIHGKKRSSGKPVLKNTLNQWLRQLELVLAFCSATPREGHGGAMYVLLRR